MKFVCDKCKTRYSIGEDRVRGKILKIRCKNCASVITVREGMDASGEPNRTGTATMAVPLIDPNMLAPSALQEEWYVSIDGVQTGPLSLQAAQKWITSKPFDAELHCWNEGFEDWLPVDKVGHFRNLRQRPAPRERPKTAPPPLPEKPLFAATMAAYEKDASGPKKTSVPSMPTAATSNGAGLRPSAPAVARPPFPTGKPSAPALPTSSPAVQPKPSSPTPARGSGSASLSRPPASHAASASSKFLATGVAPKSAGAAALADAFGPDDPNDGLTAVNAPHFEDEIATRAEPAAARPRNVFDLGAAPAAAAPPAQPTVQQALDDEDDGLAIGEVSRVVKLTDLLPKPKASGTGSSASLQRASGSAAALGGTGAQPRLSPSELGMKVDPALASSAAPGVPAADESIVAASFAQKHRRGLMVLLAFSALLVAGVVGVVAWVVSKNSDEIGGGFGGMKQIDTSRPEDIVRKQLPIPDTGSGSAHLTQNTRPRIPIRTNTTTNNTTVIDDPTGNSLQASEVEDMATKQGEGTKRCYMRAQKGAMGFEIADLKKIAVTLSVAKDGTVTDVQLSQHGADSFGQCLIARIKGWRFRASSGGGTFRISLAFSS